MDINESKVAVVTGGSSGLGAAAATALSNQGAKLCLFDMNADLGHAKAKELNATFFHVDVSDADAVKTAFDEVRSLHGGLDILVNCAGIGPPAKTLSKGEPHDPALFAKVLQVNLIGTFYCGSHAAAIMAKSDPQTKDGGRGVIINTASVAAFEGQIGQVAYAASKGGVVGMTLPMARDLSQIGIRVCTIAPGLFLTPLLQSLSENVQESLGKQVPFPSRLGDPKEYAQLVCHIVENEMLNGETIRLDGAIRMAPK